MQNVELLAVPKHWQADDEHGGGDQIRQPEADVTLSVDHAKLAGQSANVDEKVEPVEDTRSGNSRVDNDALTLCVCLDTHTLLGNLFGNKGRDVGLEGTSSEPHDNQTNDESCEGAVGLGQDRWCRGSDKDDMTNFSDDDRVDNGLEATEIGISNPSTEERAAVDPESIERGKTESDLLSHAKSTWLGFVIMGIQGSAGGCFERLSDVVGVDGDGTVVRHALDQLNKGNLERWSQYIAHVQ